MQKVEIKEDWEKNRRWRREIRRVRKKTEEEIKENNIMK
jgi:hypothetical protein